jgi:hypothetical protein
MKIEKRWDAEYEVTVVRFTDEAKDGIPAYDTELVIEADGQHFFLWDKIRQIRTSILQTSGRTVDQLIEDVDATRRAVFDAEKLEIN